MLSVRIRLFLFVIALFGVYGCTTQTVPSPPQVTAATTVAPQLGILSADFPEPFVPLTTGASDQVLAKALEHYRADTRSKSQKVDTLETFLRENPKDAWAPSVRLNLGLYYHQTGRFTRALSNLQSAWEQLRPAEDLRLKALADHALGEYALTLAHLGRYETLEPLLAEVKERSLQGSATELVAAARVGLLSMNVSPETSFLCGPAALRRIGELTSGWNDDSQKLLKTLPSTRKGTSLAQVHELSEKLHLDYQMAFRSPGSAVLTPSVTHWKVGHFGALLNPENGLYPVGDDTAGYGREQIRIEAAALDEEASGYFLVHAGPLPSGWRPVSLKEGQGVWGRGNTGLRVDQDTTSDKDVKINKSKDCPMTTWSAHAMLVSLSLTDTPVGLSPAAFSVPFQVTYSQREVGQPAVFDYANLGPKWTCNWTSYVTDVRSVSKKARLYQPGGGTDEYAFATAIATTSKKGAYSQAVLSFDNDGFVLDWPDGSRVLQPTLTVRDQTEFDGRLRAWKSRAP